MTLLKTQRIKLYVIALTIVLAGCYAQPEAQDKLTHYCPELNLEITGASSGEYTNLDQSGRRTYILTYNPDDEGHVNDYFVEGGYGFVKMTDNAFFDKDSGDTTFLKPDHIAVGKRFRSGKNLSVVVFNKTRHSIMIIEFYKK